MGLAGCRLSDDATIRPISDYGRQTQALYETVFGWTLGIFLVVELLLIFALWRYRRRADDPEVPEQVHGHTWLEIGWTLAPAAILLVIAIPTMSTIFRQQAPSPTDALQVTAVGHQWWWEFIYPELGFTTANELHVPRGRAVNLTLTSGDVIHSFWVPRLGGKRDLNPGSENTIVFTADSVGVFDGQCAEFCGTSHANMRMKLLVVEPSEFEAWADRQAQPARPDSAGYQTFLASGCAACHAIDGTPAQGRIGPNLTHFGSRRTFASGLFPNEREPLAGWLRNPDSLKPGALMPDLNLSEERVASLLRLLEGLK
ncbi:MAG TPA: cytochrome c oxidase subunit II [Acidimicrobiia bacterium]|nr:cytochrome c oxidase subunit II [Acidimicrobiia bacterium]